MKKVTMCSLIGIFLLSTLLFSFPVRAEDIMRYSPRTPAGGGFADTAHRMNVAIVVEHGSEALVPRQYYYNTYTYLSDIDYNANASPVNIYDTDTTVTTGAGGDYTQTIDNN